jgi:hypothetical protein
MRKVKNQPISFEMAIVIWFFYHKKQFQHIEDQMKEYIILYLTPYWSEKDVSIITQEEINHFHAQLVNVVHGNGHRYDWPVVLMLMNILISILSEATDSLDINSDGGSRQWYLSENLQHPWFFHLHCRDKATEITEEICRRINIDLLDNRLIEYFGDSAHANNCEAVTSWVIKKWHALGYQVNEYSDELFRELEHAFRVVLSDAGYQYEGEDL